MHETNDICFITGRNSAVTFLGDVLVLGLGKSGKAVVDYLIPLLGDRVEGLYLAAGEPNDAARATARELEQAGVVVGFGQDAVAALAEQAGGGFDLCVVSPGIPQTSDFYQSAAAASLDMASEVEFAWREAEYSSVWVAITGTNGKTTTTALTEHILKAAGMNASAVGNIGDTCMEAVASGKAQVYVVEVSSYQLATAEQFTPKVAALLNITPDHLAWHGGFDAYAQAKWHILDNLDMIEDGVAVLCATDDEVRSGIRRLRAESRDERGFDYIPVGCADGVAGDMRARCGADNAAFQNADGRLVVAFKGQEHVLLKASELQIKGSHNVENALVAASIALALGVGDDIVASALASFAPLAHRIEPCGSVSGVACYNDSKATNVDATLKAFAAFGEARPIVFLGGHDKGTPLEPLVAAAQEHAKAVVCFGEARDRFLEAFGGVGSADGGLSVLSAEHLEDALDAGLAIARPGDILLLSPACSSFDEFSCYEERGDVFKSLVAKRAAAANGKA